MKISRFFISKQRKSQGTERFIACVFLKKQQKNCLDLSTMAKAAMHLGVSGRWLKLTLKRLVKACTNKEFFIFYKIFVDKTFGIWQN